MKEYPKLLISDETNNVYDVPYLQATGMSAGEYVPLEVKDLIKLPKDSELFMLPARPAVGFDPETGKIEAVENDPYDQSKKCFAVAVFLEPGYTSTYSASYVKRDESILPLFCYTAIAFYKGDFYAAGVLVDREKRQKLEGMPVKQVEKGVKSFRKIFPENRLVRHLEKCALCYGCPAAKNFFLSRYEAPLPTSPGCNSRCLGCISLQPDEKCPVTQERITFIPNPKEISEVALYHISKVRNAVVSFGQGCEGEPLMAADSILEAVKLIRAKTSKGMINLNTNASKPKIIEKLFSAGLDSIRVSINSMQKKYYDAYYRPTDYVFQDVISSMKIAQKKNKFVSINYLVMPGFTDRAKEVKALYRNLEKGYINMIQWRNLNYDPIKYFDNIGVKDKDETIGIKNLIKKVKNDYPTLMHGYFNPSRNRIKIIR